ncbi:MAG: SusC/RagA family TonB-linked outer membrane protein, partial [Bacteroidales bacterium]|nr:SusC/RagA family TonB-linked outer membrane protein [Bacteroidales bacterium]
MKPVSLKTFCFSVSCLALLVLSATPMNAQPRKLSGRISDEKGELLMGVVVQEKGTSNGVMTDADGQYSIMLTTDNPVIVISFMGYTTLEEVVGNRTIIDAAMAESLSELDELVVIGYGVQKKVSVVGAQSAIKPSEIKMPTASLSSVVQGRLAGVVAVQRSGEPGHDESDIWIRGLSTFIGQSSRPLVLVDGVERSFNHIDPEDIDSFTVLKDASATAVYGVRGANGVIIIQTKPGKVGKQQFSVDYYETVITETKRPELADAYTYMDAFNEAYLNTYGNLYYTDEYISATKMANGVIPNENPAIYNRYLYPAVDWVNEIFRDFGNSRRFNMSVRGGVPNATYYVSLTYYYERGLTRDTEMENYDANMRFDRYNYTANFNLRPTKTTSVDFGLNGFLSSGNYPERTTAQLFASALQINPVYLPLMMPDGSLSGISNNGDMRNPYGDLIRRGYRNEARNQINTSVRVSQDFGFWNWSEGLNLNAMIAFDVNNSRNLNYTKQESTYYFGGTRNPRTGIWNTGLPDPETGIWEGGDVFNRNGTYNIIRTYTGSDDLDFSRSQNMTRSTYFETSLNYNRDFGRHNVTGLFLYNHKIYSAGDPGDLIASLPYKQQGIAGRLTYGYDNRYLLELNAGYNGSENFDPENRFGFFPAAGIGWVTSNEEFWGGNFANFFSFFKIRYTIGLVGSDTVAGRRFMYQDQMTELDGTRFGTTNNTGWGIGKYGAKVGWSTSLKHNLGFDMKFFRNSLSATVELFREHRTGIFLSRATIPNYAGFIEMPYANLGIVDNKGIDLQAEYNARLGNRSFLTLRANLTYNEDVIVEDDQPIKPYAWQETRGTNVNGHWGW